MAKATPYKAGSKSTLIRGRDVGLYDHTIVDKWRNEVNDSNNLINDYINRRKKQEWMSEDELGNYRSALERYKSSTGSLRGLSDYDEEDEKKWNEYVSSLSTDFMDRK